MLKVGICGGGFIGCMHAACWRALRNAKVVAAADVRKDYAKKLAGGDAKMFRTAKDLIAKADEDVVDICLPTHLHAEHAILTAKRGLNCLSEKPLSRTLADANAVVRAIEKAGTAFMTAQVIRFWPEYMVLKRHLDQRTYGKLLELFLARVSPRPTWAWKNWLADARLSGGAVLDLHVHDTDFILYALGAPKTVQCVGAGSRKMVDYIHTNYVYPGMAVSAEGGWNLPPGYPFQMSFRAVFEKGTLSYSSLNEPLTFYGANGKNRPVKVPRPRAKAKNAGGNISDLGGYYNEIKYFADCLSRGRKPETATVEDGRDAVALVLKELRIAERNRR